jgi:hypothetical protein
MINELVAPSQSATPTVDSARWRQMSSALFSSTIQKTARFAPFPGADYPMEKLGSKQVSIGGVGQDMHPVSHEIVDVGPLQVMHILGTDHTKEESRIAGSAKRIGFFDRTI